MDHHHDGVVVEVKRNDLELDAPVVLANPDQPGVRSCGRRHPGRKDGVDQEHRVGSADPVASC